MSDAAMNSAISALLAESSALSVISQNLANSDTTGYKALSNNFSSLVTGESVDDDYAGGGVVSTARQAVDVQGLIESASASTDLAINGKGLFVVSQGTNSNDIYYTRDGSFDTDSNGNLVLSGTDYYLMGWPTDGEGNITAANTDNVSALEPVNVDKYNSSAAATTIFSLEANLPAEAQSDTSTYSSGFSTTLAVYDSLGVQQSIPVTFVPDGSNTWTMTVGNPTSASSSSTQTGTLDTTTSGDAYSYKVTFNSDGSLASVAGIADSDGFTPPTDSSGNPEIEVSSWTDGAAASTISLKLGASGSSTGLTQYDSGDTTPAINVEKTTQDGVAYGQLSTVKVDSDGTVVAEYTNGQQVDIYKIPVADFPDDSGLEAVSDNVYKQTADAGDYTLNVAGTNGAGSIDGSSLESSTVDTATEFSNLVVAQQAYSAAAQVISTDKQMFTSLIDVMQ